LQQARTHKRSKAMKQDSRKQSPFAPVDMAGAKKTGMRTQFGALCYRMRKGKPEVLLVTSRRTRRWIIPKGWPMDGMSPAQGAAREAYEEAGVEGKVFDFSWGAFTYTKRLSETNHLPCAVLVYPLKVKKIHDSYPEKSERKRKWMRPADAAKKVDEAGLAQMLRHFDPAQVTKV